MEPVLTSNNQSRWTIILVSVVIPLVVALLLFTPAKFDAGTWVYELPTVNAILNSLTSVLLVSALIAIKLKNISLHRSLMTSALVLGILFLVSYVLYHASAPSVKFGDANFDGAVDSSELLAVGSKRAFYFFVLISHILLSIGVVPFVLFAFYYALTGRIEKHKKLVKWTFPVWLYVSVTGVIVYLLIKEYYPWG